MQKRFWQFYKSGVSILLMGALFMACSSNQEKNDTTKEEVVKTPEELEWEKALKDSTLDLPLNEHVDMLLSTIQEYHKQAFDSEQEKLNSSQLLIDEIEQSMETYDRTAFKKIKAYLEETKNSLYTEESMSSLEAMETYDVHTMQLIIAWKDFREATDDFDNHARAVVIYEDIMKADKSDQGIRTNYNTMVHDFNKLLDEKGDEIKALGEQYATLEPFIFFYGEDPVVD